AALPELPLLPYGENYYGNNWLVIWLMFGAVLTGLFYPFSHILASMNRMWFGLAYNLGNGLLSLVLIYFLIPRYHAAGLAAGLGISTFISSIICVLYIYRHERAFIANISLFKSIGLVLFLYMLCVFA